MSILIFEGGVAAAAAAALHANIAVTASGVTQDGND